MDDVDFGKVKSTTLRHSIVLQSDIGTIVLHWLTVLSMGVSLLTGLRISADHPDATFANAVDSVLPQGEIWTWHVLAGLTLCATTAAYWVYLKRAALRKRNSPVRLRTLTPPTTKNLQLRAINVALHWFAYTSIVLLTITGGALFLGHASWFLTLHNGLAWVMLIYIAIHTAAHFAYGGFAQLLRLFRPSSLVENSNTQNWPLGIGLATGMISIVALITVEWNTRVFLKPVTATAAPVLDGSLDEPFWQHATGATIKTHQGANLGGNGSSAVQIKVAVSKEKIYFAFKWQDPTRSLMRVPVVKTKDGWRTMARGADIADVNDYYEDKFAILFSQNDGLGGGEATFLGKSPLTNYPKSPHERGLHYTTDGRILDLWQWKSSRGGLLGHVDDMHFGPPKQPTAKQARGTQRYAAGYDADPGNAIYEYNYIADGPKGYDSPVRLKRLPLDLSNLRLALGTIPGTSDESNDQGSQWWMTLNNSVPYSADLDNAIPVGTWLPSTLNINKYEGDRADISGGALWRNGHWTLEISRDRDTGSPYDMTFHPGQRVYLWVSVFDHNQTRHTRHQRAVILDLPQSE